MQNGYGNAICYLGLLYTYTSPQMYHCTNLHVRYRDLEGVGDGGLENKVAHFNPKG